MQDQRAVTRSVLVLALLAAAIVLPSGPAAAAPSGSVSCGGLAPADTTCSEAFTLQCRGLALELLPDRALGVVSFTGRLHAALTASGFRASFECVLVDGAATNGDQCFRPTVEGSCRSGIPATLAGAANGAGRWGVGASWS